MSTSWRPSGPTIGSTVMGRRDSGPTRPRWCGKCDDPRSRLVQVGEDSVARCPACHPATQSGGRHAPGAVRAGADDR